jgi:hypothetical protein
MKAQLAVFTNKTPNDQTVPSVMTNHAHTTATPSYKNTDLDISTGICLALKKREINVSIRSDRNSHLTIFDLKTEYL